MAISLNTSEGALILIVCMIVIILILSLLMQKIKGDIVKELPSLLLEHFKQSEISLGELSVKSCTDDLKYLEKSINRLMKTHNDYLIWRKLNRTVQTGI